MNSTAIREARLQQPFKPFVMKLVDKRELVVRHPEFVAVSPNHLLFINENTDAITWIEPLLVVTLDFLSTLTPTSGNGKPASS